MISPRLEAAQISEENNMEDGLLKITAAVISPTLTILLAALVGQRISAKWNEIIKRRESQLSVASDFYKNYGEFRAIWKNWNWLLQSNLREKSENFDEMHRAIFDRASRAEGHMEAILLKISAERILSREDLDELGNLRQAFQVLRERIRALEPVDYGSSGHVDYIEFKRLSTSFGALLARRSDKLPSAASAFESFKAITDNSYESRWRNAGRASRRDIGRM